MTTFEQIPQAANSSAPFWTVMLFMIVFIILISLSVYGIIAALLTASFIGLALGILLVYAGLIAWESVIVFLGVIIAIIIYIILFDTKN